MVKVFDTISDFEAYVLGGMVAGDLYYVKEDKSVHFRTNNIDGSDKNYGIGVGDDLVPTGNIALTENGTDIDVAEYATASVNVPIPDGYIVPTGNLEISANGTNIDVAAYATVSVDVEAPAPSYTWTTVSDAAPQGYNVDVYLEMNVGSTYIFKSSAGDVEMYLRQSDSDGDGDVDADDDMYPIGRMVPNKEYYLTATNDYVNQESEFDSGKARIYFNLGSSGSPTVQFAIVPEPSEDSDSEDDSPVEPSNDSPVVGE